MAYEDTLAFKLLQKFESMRERMQHYIAVIDQCPVPAFISSREGDTFIYINDAFRRLTGKRIQDVQKLDWLTVVHPDDREITQKNWKQFITEMKDGVPVAHHYRYINDSTGVIIPAITYTTAVIGNGVVGYIVPSDCGGLLLLGIDLNCPNQQLKT